MSGSHPWTIWGIPGVPLPGQAKRVTDLGRKGGGRDTAMLGAKELCE